MIDVMKYIKTWKQIQFKNQVFYDLKQGFNRVKYLTTILSNSQTLLHIFSNDFAYLQNQDKPTKKTISNKRRSGLEFKSNQSQDHVLSTKRVFPLK